MKENIAESALTAIRTYISELNPGTIIHRSQYHQNPEMTFVVTKISESKQPFVIYERLTENKGKLCSTRETGIISDLRIRRFKEGNLSILGNIHEKEFENISLTRR